MIQTDVDIVNIALVKLGAQRVQSLSDPRSPIEKSASAVYGHYRDAELSKRRWRFALRRAVLTPEPADTLSPVSRYQLPTDPWCLRPLRDNASIWEQEGRFLIGPANVGPIGLLYIARVPEGTFDPTFAEVLSCKVAENLAEQLTQSNEKKDRALQMYQAALTEAKLTNAYVTGAEDINADDSNTPFLTGRYAGYDIWGVTQAAGPYAGVRGDLAAVPADAAPNPVPETVTVK